MAKRVLEALADIHPNQFATKGGTHGAIRAVEKAMEEGFCWTIEVDISNCYLSFDGESIANFLPLPKKVTRGVIMSEYLSLVPGNFAEGLGPVYGPEDEFFFSQVIADARPGIPQGSAVSPLVTEILLASVFDCLPKGAVVINYADNFLVMARDEKDAVKTTKALGSAICAHPAGLLRPKLVALSKPGEKFTFLGHTLQMTSSGVRIEPSEENDLKFKHELERGLRYLSDGNIPAHKREKKLRELRRYVRSWFGAFRECDGIEQYRSKVECRIEKAAAQLN